MAMVAGSHVQLACIFMSLFVLHFYCSGQDACIHLYNFKTNFFIACDICEDAGGEILSLNHLIKQSFNISDTIKEYGILWIDQQESVCQDHTGQCKTAALKGTKPMFVNSSCSLDIIFWCYGRDSNCTDYPLNVSTTITTEVYRTTTPVTTTKGKKSDEIIPINILIPVVVVVLLVAIVIAGSCFIRKRYIKPTVQFARDDRGVEDHHVYDLPDRDRPAVVRDESTGGHHYDHLDRREPIYYTTFSPHIDQ